MLLTTRKRKKKAKEKGKENTRNTFSPFLREK